MPEGVNKERRRAFDARVKAALEVLAHPVAISPLPDLAHKPDCIKPGPRGILSQMIVVQRSLMFAEDIVHLPEAALRAGRLRRLRRGDAIVYNCTYAESFGRDPQFAQFYRSLDAYKASFSKKSDVMVLDPSSDFFKTLRGSK